MIEVPGKWGYNIQITGFLSGNKSKLASELERGSLHRLVCEGFGNDELKLGN